VGVRSAHKIEHVHEISREVEKMRL
jgi:hypothetical protein